MKKIVTILLPTRAFSSPYLPLAYRSVLRQSSPHWSLVVICEKSELREDFFAQMGCEDDSRVRCCKNRSTGVTSALNPGMEMAETPFVCVLHDDDELAVEAVETLSRHIGANPGFDYFHSARRCIDEQGRFLTPVKRPKTSFLVEDFVSGGQVKHLHCWRVSKANEIGGMDETFALHGADDYDFPWSMAEHGATFFPVPECLYYYRDHRAAPRLTTHIPLSKQVEELRRIFLKHGVSDSEIEQQIKRRRAGYLQQALFSDPEEKERKENDPAFDSQLGWRDQNPG